MKKRYLKTPEEVLALKNTDTKIYIDAPKGSYIKFIDGLICWFDEDDERSWMLNTRICGCDKAYILEEEPMQESTAEDVGKLCWFENEERSYGFFDVLFAYREDETFKYNAENNSTLWKHCRRAKPSEVAELTGYKVEEK